MMNTFQLANWASPKNRSLFLRQNRNKILNVFSAKEYPDIVSEEPWVMWYDDIVVQNLVPWKTDINHKKIKSKIFFSKCYIWPLLSESKKKIFEKPFQSKLSVHIFLSIMEKKLEQSFWKKKEHFDWWNDETF